MKLKNHLGLALLAASVIWSGFASAKPAQCSIPLMARPTLITDFEKDGSFTIGAGETSQSEREIRNGWREPKWTTM